MQLIEDILRRSRDASEPRRTLHIRQAERSKIVAASSEAEPISPIELTDRLLQRERVLQ